MKANNIEVQYSDTDSCFFKQNNMSIDEVKEVIGGLNLTYNQIAKELNLDTHNFDMKFEKIYKTLFFADAKKRYAGLLKFKEGKEVNIIDITGFSSKRSDTPQIARDFEKNIFEMILLEKPKKEVDEYVLNFKTKIKQGVFTAEQIALPIGISKEVYKNMPIHIRAVNVSRKYHNLKVVARDKIKYIYVKGNTWGHSENVVAFKTRMPGGYIIDYDKMIDRIVTKKIEPIYECLGWGVNGNIKKIGDFFK